MTEERYEGERQGLGLFLEELRPVVAATLGTDNLLHHAIKKALASGRLKALRHARALFNALPREQRQTLQAGIVAHAEPAHRHSPPALLEPGDRQPRPVVAIDCETAPGNHAAPRATLRHEVMDEVGLRVLVRPGSLPSSVAARLREMADLVEHDRRLLSARYWDAARVEVVSGKTTNGADHDTAESG